MMCEDCGIRPAKFHLMTIINGDRVERNLCPTCMARHQKKLPGLDFSNLAGILNSILEDKSDSATEQARQDAEYEGYVCEQCGMTYGEFQKCGMLGCANCYQAFKTPMTALLQRVHGNTQHAGRVPGGAHSGTSIRMNIDRLRQKLQKAIADEEYEQAAKLRDAIRALTIQLERKESDIKVRPQERLAAEDARGGEEDV
ncbi:MAG: UvrB/UvrC motif-containing protein [Clostridia bacterium]|nr:UvrB/UvrC motif-containing protein [Clostridia bacterium]